MAEQLRRPLPAFLARQAADLLLFSGKGGVGKTTCAAATAVYLARLSPEQSFLVMSIDPAHSLADCFAGATPLANLEVRELDAAASLEEFRTKHSAALKQIALRGTFLDDHDITSLFELSMPGLDEVLALDEVASLTRAGDYGCIIVDTAPTGHTLRFLELPAIMRKWLETLDAMLAKHRYLARLFAGGYRRDETDLFLEEMLSSLDHVASLLTDRRRCRFVPVTIAESFSVAETERLVSRLGALSIHAEELVVNMLRPPSAGCDVCEQVWKGQQVRLAQLRRSLPECTLWQAPLHNSEVRGFERLASFWETVQPVTEPLQVPAPSRAMPPEVLDPAPLPGQGLSLLVFAGKGGVGKTTLAAAVALMLSRQYPERNVLLFSTDPAHSLSDCLDMQVGHQGVHVCGGLTAMEIDAQQEYENLRRQYMSEASGLFRSLSGGVGVDLKFDREVIEHIMDLCPPGLDEVMALSTMAELRSQGTYDMFVIDSAPTGHFMRLLELPALVEDWLKVMFDLLLKYKRILRLPTIAEYLVGLSKRIKALRSLLTNPEQAMLCPVTIPTHMAFEETLDLLQAGGRAGIHASTLFINQVNPPGACSLCNAVARAEAEVMRKMRRAMPELHHTIIHRRGEPRGLRQLEHLGRSLYRGWTMRRKSSNRGRQEH